MRAKIVIAVLLVTLMTVFAGCNVSLFTESTDNSRGPAVSKPWIKPLVPHPVETVAVEKSSSKPIDIQNLVKKERPVFYSTPEGRILKFETTGTWIKNLDKLPTGSIMSLTVDPVDSQIIYAVLYHGNDYQVAKTIDGGKNWFVCYTGYDIVGQGGVSFAISNENHNILYIGGGGGVQKSTDGGKTWKVLENGIATNGFLVWTIAINPNNNSILFAGGEDQSAILKATEGLDWNGKCWVDKNGTPKIYPDEYWEYPHIPRLFYSENAGESWTELTSHCQLPGYDGNPVSIGNPLDIVFNPEDSQIIYLGPEGNGLFRSKDGGKTWESLASGVVNHVAIDSGGTLYIADFNGRVLQSKDNGKSWQENPNAVIITWQPLP